MAALKDAAVQLAQWDRCASSPSRTCLHCLHRKGVTSWPCWQEACEEGMLAMRP